MAHRIYSTEGLVLSSRPLGESNKLLELFTAKLGLVAVSVQAVRALRSKLRYHLQNYNFVTVSLVRGKETWRLVGAEPVVLAAPRNLKAFQILQGRVILLLRRLIHGEEESNGLFTEVKTGLAFARDQLTPATFLLCEELLNLRILAHLGYIESTGALAQLVTTNWSQALLEQARDLRPLVLEAVAQALEHSNL